MPALEDDFSEDDRRYVEAMAAIWSDVMSAGDRSTAVVAMQKAREGDVANMLTTKSSPNDRFWTLMTKLGWAEPAPDALDGLPEDLPNRKIFVAHRLNDVGKDMLPKFLAAIA